MIAALIDPSAAPGDDLADAFLPGPTLDALACFAIYRRSYGLRLRKCLEEQFPATRDILGAELFRDFADAYLRDRPSQSYTLFALGESFPQWLDENRPDREAPAIEREAWIDFMIELSRYERELYRLFDAPGHEGRPWPARETPDDALMLQPCLALMDFRFPVAWRYHETRARRAPKRIPDPGRFFYVALRKDYLTTTLPITELHFRFLSAIASSGTIDAALDAIAVRSGAPRAAVARSWRDEVRDAWIAAGFFVRLGE
jgi:hypothetical protein